jgi:hypothetical protein
MNQFVAQTATLNSIGSLLPAIFAFRIVAPLGLANQKTKNPEMAQRQPDPKG